MGIKLLQNKLLSFSYKSQQWIRDNRAYFLDSNDKKKKLEYLHYLFTNNSELKVDVIEQLLIGYEIDLKDLKKSNAAESFIEGVTKENRLMDHEKLDVVTLMGLYFNEDISKHNENIIKESLLQDLVDFKIPFDIIANRNMRYIITHFLMFAIKGPRLEFVSVYSSELSLLIELSILVSIIQEDLDVLFELILCLILYKDNFYITENCQKLLLELLIQIDYLNEGVPPYWVSEDRYQVIKNQKEHIYHTTLVCGMIYQNLATETDNIKQKVDKDCIESNQIFRIFLDILRYNSKELFVGLSADENKMERIFEYRHLIVALIIDRSYYEDFDYALHLSGILKKRYKQLNVDYYSTEIEQLRAVIEVILREDVVNAKIK